jgi:protein involved in polysaccharide export with SLBB domain
MQANGGLRRRGWLLGPVLALAVGCASDRPRLEQALRATPAQRGPDVSAQYHVHCPDVLAVEVVDAAPWSGPRTVGTDGRIDAGDGSRLRVDGQTTAEVAAAFAEHAGISPDGVRVRVAEYNSQQVYLFGEVAGLQRALPYQGPETVLDLLRRAGGITPGAAPGDVQVIRAHVAEGKTPEIFHVDLEALVLKKDLHSNVVLEPFDQVYIGQSCRSRLGPCVPPCLHPAYESLCGMRRPITTSPHSQP